MFVVTFLHNALIRRQINLALDMVSLTDYGISDTNKIRQMAETVERV